MQQGAIPPLDQGRTLRRWHVFKRAQHMKHDFLHPQGVCIDPFQIEINLSIRIAIRERDETLIDLCLRRGYRYCNRLHIEIFGNKRGT